MKNIEKRAWINKASSIPKLPKFATKQGYLDSIHYILMRVEEGTNKDDKIIIEASKSIKTLHELCVILRPTKIVYQSQWNKWQVSDDFKIWLKDRNDIFIAEYFNARIKYISEMLSYLNEPKSVSEILKHAKDKYSMAWKNTGPIFERLVFFRELGLVEYRKYERSYSLTSKGTQFLKENPEVTLEEINTHIYDNTNNQEKIEIDSKMKYLITNNKSSLEKRKNSIGYIAGGVYSGISTITEALNLLQRNTNLETISLFFKENINISKSSTESFMYFLMNLNFINLVGEKEYIITEEGTYFLNSEDKELILVFYLQNHFKYVFEILHELENKNLTAKILTNIGKVDYRMETDSLDQIQKRLKFLKNAKLVFTNGKMEYLLTHRGIKLLKTLQKYFNIFNVVESNNLNIETKRNIFSENIIELRNASEDSQNYKRFEKILELIFNDLGFETEYYGQSGKTDIILTSPTIEKFKYRVAVDAKTNNLGKIRVDSINPITLKKHKEIHNADYSLIVAKEFVGNTLLEGAFDDNITLLEINTLEEIVRKHSEYPLNALEYEVIFKEPGLVTIDRLSETYVQMKREKFLYKLIMENLIDLNSDREIKGLLDTRDLYLLLRTKEIFFDKPVTEDEIREMLELLSNPLIDCVGKTKDSNDKNKYKYFAKGTLNDAALKFGFYYKLSL